MISVSFGWRAARRRLLPLALGCAVLGAGLGDAAGKDARIKVPADEETILLQPTIADENCKSGGLWVIKVLSEPEHGKFTVKKTLNTMPDQIVGSTKCSGRQVPGLTLAYTPNKGFRGRDFLAFRMSSSDRGHVSHEFKITVLVE